MKTKAADRWHTYPWKTQDDIFMYNWPADLLHSGTDCRDRGFSHNALAGETQQLSQEQNPFVRQSWSISCPDRQCQTRPHQLPTGEKHDIWVVKSLKYINLYWYKLPTLFNLYKSKIFRSTCGIFKVHPCKSQNLAIWSKKLSLTLVCAWEQKKKKDDTRVLL